MDVLTIQQRIAKTAGEKPAESFTSLNHYLDLNWMKEAYHRLRIDSAPGVDGITVTEYGKNLEDNLPDLIDRLKSGRYVAPPVRRVHICFGPPHGPHPFAALRGSLRLAVSLRSAPKATAKRLDLSACRQSRISSCSVRCSCYWNPSTSTTSWTARMGSGQDAPRTEHSNNSGSRAWTTR